MEGSILELVLKGGPTVLAAVMFWLLMQERKERKESQQKLLEVSNSLIEHATKTEAAINGFTTLLGNVGAMIARCPAQSFALDKILHKLTD